MGIGKKCYCLMSGTTAAIVLLVIACINKNFPSQWNCTTCVISAIIVLCFIVGSFFSCKNNTQ